MNNSLFIFQYIDSINYSTQKKITVCFVNQENLENQTFIADEIKEFFETNILSDYVVVLLPDYLKPEQVKWFTDGKEDTFKRLPGKSQQYFQENYFVYTFDKFGKQTAILKALSVTAELFFKNLFRHGSTEIFKRNGGLVESSTDHHFVFPSKKHCAKFIRTGNVLIHSAEVFFIAYQLLSFFTHRQSIYCDTSSINVLPFAVLELKRRFKDANEFPNVHSFVSYDVFESRKTPFSQNDLVLISSSTSGNIIDRLLAQKLAREEQIALIYFLGPNDRYTRHEKNIVCNLTWDEQDFNCGVKEFETYSSEEKCQLCKNNSYAITIAGDVFLTVKPKVSKLLLTATSKHIPKFLNDFVGNYQVDKSIHPNDAIIRAFYKETTDDPDANYETYIDTSTLYENPHYQEKLDRLINKHIPANTVYLIHLPDKSSEKLARIIENSTTWNALPAILRLDDKLQEKLVDKPGCAVIIASCIVTGKHLLHISRMMRAFNSLNLVYFIGVMGTNNEAYLSTLKNNLSRGKDKSDERPVIAVETIYCSLDKYKTVWAREKSFLEKIYGEAEEDGPLQLFFKERLAILRDNKQAIGLTESVFMKNHTGEVLYLRKNFAFWNFEYEESQIFQSEVFFTINSIINFLENKDILEDDSLQQSNYVRTLLSAENFQRFNDGIIQACLLRASKPEYLAYDLDSDSSRQMTTLLESQIEKHNTEHGEALMEFLLAVGMKTLRLSRVDTRLILEKACRCPDLIINEFAKIIMLELTNEHLL